MASLRSRIVAEARVQARAMDWRAAAELVLAFPPLSQGISCGSTADQQEGVWRGWENARVIRNRLIATAADGGDTVGVAVDEAQLLVDTALRVADWDTARTRDNVDPAGPYPSADADRDHPRNRRRPADGAVLAVLTPAPYSSLASQAEGRRLVPPPLPFSGIRVSR